MNADRESQVPDLAGLRLSDTTLRLLADANPQAAIEELATKAPQLVSVTSLVLKRCDLSARDIEPLGRALRHLTNLRQLDLGQNRLGSEGLAELGRYAVHLGKLQSLAVHRNGVGSMGLSRFMQTAEHLECLESFDLSENPLGDEGASALAASAEKLAVLRRLGLFDCGIGDNGAESLRGAVCRATWTRSLREIGFARNPVMEYEELCGTNAADRWRGFGGDAAGLDLRDLMEDFPPDYDPAQSGPALSSLLESRPDDALSAPVDHASVSRIRHLLQRGVTASNAKRGPVKRSPAELPRSLLALLDACVEWPALDISQRKLHASSLLQEKRAGQGLRGDVSLTTVGNHLNLLAKMSGGSVATLDDKKQASRMDADAKRRLVAIRPILERLIAELRLP